jgi:hypothetical protein
VFDGLLPGLDAGSILRRERVMIGKRAGKSLKKQRKRKKQPQAPFDFAQSRLLAGYSRSE